MLKVIGVSELVPIKYIADIYVPIKIKFGEWDVSKGNTIYWRTGDFENSLIEIGIASQSGILRSITLIQAMNVFFDSEVQYDQTIQTIRRSATVKPKKPESGALTVALIRSRLFTQGPLDITCVDPTPEKSVKEAIGSRVTLVMSPAGKPGPGNRLDRLTQRPAPFYPR